MKVHNILCPDGYCSVGMPRVDRLMQVLLPLIGYTDIKMNHMTSYIQFLQKAKKFLKLVNLTKMPTWTPRWGSLYFNMLFQKI